MNPINSILKICLGAGLFLSCFGIWNNRASAVSLASYSANSALENLLTTDFELTKSESAVSFQGRVSMTETLFFSLKEDASSIWEELIIGDLLGNLSLAEAIKFQITISPEERPNLLESLVASLEQLEFNQEQASNSETTGKILAQTTYSDIYQNIYDFDTELRDNFLETPTNNLPQLRENHQNVGFFRQNIQLPNTQVAASSNSNYLNNIQGISNRISTNGFSVAASSSYSVGSTNPATPNFSRDNILDLGDRLKSLSTQTGISNNSGLTSREIEIEKINLKSVKRPSIEKTPEQIALEERIEQEREKLEKRMQKLREKLAREREKRKQQRIREREKEARERERKLEQMARTQNKLRNRYR
ncbi:MAG TPA: hypothetical protein ACFCUY_18995 [Xenococcaceae cyanobacterium]